LGFLDGGQYQNDGWKLLVCANTLCWYCSAANFAALQKRLLMSIMARHYLVIG